jgi:hypothetical protein
MSSTARASGSRWWRWSNIPAAGRDGRHAAGDRPCRPARRALQRERRCRGAILTRLGGKDIANRLIDRYELTGGGADAVRDIFSPAADTSTSVGVIGTLLLLVAVLSFTRAVQRLFEQTWELAPLSVRNTLNGLRWGLALVAFASRAAGSTLSSAAGALSWSRR